MAGYGGFGPSKFEQSVDGGLSNVGTALFGNPMAAGRMAYLRARAALEDQQSQDAAQKAAAQAGLAAQLHGLNGAAIQPGMVDDMLANGVLAGDNSGMGGLFLSRNANTGQPDPVVARSFVGAGHEVSPTGAFSLPGQGAIIQGQNTQADHIQQATAASAFAQALMGQQHEDTRNAATNAQSGSNNAATIAGEAERLHTSPEQMAQARILAGKGTDADKALLAQLHPGASSAFTLTPQDTGQVYGEIEAQLGIPAVVKSTGLPPPGAPSIDPALEAQVAARASDIFNSQPRDQKNLAAAVAQAIKDHVATTAADPGGWFGIGAKPKAFGPAGAPAATPAQQPAVGPVQVGPAIGAAPAGVPDGSSGVGPNGVRGIVRGGVIYQVLPAGGA